MSCTICHVLIILFSCIQCSVVKVSKLRLLHIQGSLELFHFSPADGNFLIRARILPNLYSILRDIDDLDPFSLCFYSCETCSFL